MQPTTQNSRPQKILPLACAALIAAAITASAGRAARADISITLPAAQDVTLFGGSDATANNTGSGPGMFVGSDGSSPKRGIMEFNVAGLAGATITSVTMNLTLGMVAGSSGNPGAGDQTPRTIRLFDVTTAWNPTVLGTTGKPGPGFGGTGHGFAPPNTGDATWNWAKFNQVAWGTAGGDFLSTESADTLVSQSVGTTYSWTSVQMIADVQAWANGTVANDGWLLKNDTETNTQSFRAFYTREGAAEQSVPAFAPNLVVTFTPEPATLLLLAIGTPAVLSMRRRNRKN